MTQHRRIPLIVGNWKMNGTAEEATALAESLWALAARARGEPFQVAVCPPFVHLAVVKKHLGEEVKLGAQDCSAQVAGAYTGDISAAMLKEAGCTYVIVGHSERRQYQQESDTVVQQKAATAQVQGLVPIVCIGETLEERKAGKVASILKKQIQGSIPLSSTPQTLVVAYEPVWAIGTGEVATPAQVAEAHAIIRAELTALAPTLHDTRILYGGSVKPDNAALLLALDDVDGALVGGASLQAESFWAIALAAK